MIKKPGWRKLGLGIGIVVMAFVFIYWKTPIGATVGQVPDIPSNVRDIILGVFFAFVGGNAAEHFTKAWGDKEKP